MKHLDLFSGIGGFALAADRVFGKVDHIFCEIDPFCQEVLKKHWPNSKIYGDIRTLTANPKYNGSTRTKETGAYSKAQSESKAREKLSITKFEGIDSLWTEDTRRPFILTGGFPCQPFSQAGRRKGTEDDRHLWPEMLRVIREFTPLWVIGENVGGFVTWNDGMVLRQVFADLESEGYEVQAFIIPAVSVNAPHRRDRIWIVAHRNERASRPRDVAESRKAPYIEFGTNCPSKRNDADSKCTGHEGKINQKGQSSRYSGRTQSPDWSTNWIEVATRLCRVDDGLPRRLDRNPRLKALGNAIVPQVAEEIFKAIKNL